MNLLVKDCWACCYVQVPLCLPACCTGDTQLCQKSKCVTEYTWCSGYKVRIITTANDVIHAFAVPSFGIKQDAIPGFVRDTWFRAKAVGDFYGQCAELCGKEHAYMPIHVKVLSDADYSAWVQSTRTTKSAAAPAATQLAAAGAAVSK